MKIDPHFFGKPAPVYRVTTVYGDKCFVRRDDHDSVGWKTQVPLATREGVRLTQRTNKQGLYLNTDPGKAYTIHRENIAKLEPIGEKKSVAPRNISLDLSAPAL